MGVRIAGTGGYLPGPPVDQDGTRAFLRKHPDGLSEATQERLLKETGILTRHFAIDVHDESRRESNTSMAASAGRLALEAAGLPFAHRMLPPRQPECRASVPRFTVPTPFRATPPLSCAIISSRRLGVSLRVMASSCLSSAVRICASIGPNPSGHENSLDPQRFNT